MTGKFWTQKVEILVKVCDNIKLPNDKIERLVLKRYIVIQG